MKSKTVLTAGFMLALTTASARAMAAEPVAALMKNPGGYKYFIGIVGNPSSPDISWSDDELTKIKALGVNNNYGMPAPSGLVRPVTLQQITQLRE